MLISKGNQHTLCVTHSQGIDLGKARSNLEVHLLLFASGTVYAIRYNLSSMVGV